jgi:hypothetical protein
MPGNKILQVKLIILLSPTFSRREDRPMRHDLTNKAFAAALALIASSPAWAQDQRPGGSSQSLACKFSRDHEDSRIILNGSCSGALDFSISLRIETRSASRTRGYERTFREGTGPVSDL